MSKKSPQLRFEGFTDDWEERKLGEISRMYQPLTITGNDLLPDGVPVFGANGFIGFFSEANHIEDQVTISARGEGTGTPSYVHGPVWITGNSMVVNVDDFDINKYFLFANLTANSLKKYVTGGAQPQLTRDVLVKVPITLPNADEQQKISSFFQQLDNTIALHQRKLDLLKEQKKGYLQKMFPKNGAKVPELRFAGFADDWEERKLKDIAQFNPKTVLPDEFEYVDLESVVGTEMVSHRTESKDQAPSRAQRLAQKGDVFYQTVRPYQMNNYLYDLPYDNYVFSTGYAQMRPNIDSYFLLNSVQNKQFVQHVLDRSTGTSYPAINSSDLSKIEIHVPSKLSEQQKIGAFFQSIDDTIALHQRKLDLLKEQKKGFLQKMFV